MVLILGMFLSRVCAEMTCDTRKSRRCSSHGRLTLPADEGRRSEQPKISPASCAESSLAFHRLNTSQNFFILRSCSHVVRFIDSPPDGGRKPDNSYATDTPKLTSITRLFYAMFS